MVNEAKLAYELGQAGVFSMGVLKDIKGSDVIALPFQKLAGVIACSLNVTDFGIYEKELLSDDLFKMIAVNLLIAARKKGLDVGTPIDLEIETTDEISLALLIETVTHLKVLHAYLPDSSIGEILKLISSLDNSDISARIVMYVAAWIVVRFYVRELMRLKKAKLIINDDGWHQVVDFDHPNPAEEI